MTTQFYNCDIVVEQPDVNVQKTALNSKYNLQNHSKYLVQNLVREHETINAATSDADCSRSDVTPRYERDLTSIIGKFTLSDSSISPNSTPEVISTQTSPELIVGIKRVFKDSNHYIIDSSEESSNTSKKVCLKSLLIEASAENVSNPIKINEYFQIFNSTVTAMAYNMDTRLHGSTDPVMHLKLRLKNMFFFNNNQEKMNQIDESHEINSNVSENNINGPGPSPVHFFEKLCSSYSEYTKLQSTRPKSAELEDTDVTMPPLTPLILQSSCSKAANEVSY